MLRPTTWSSSGHSKNKNVTGKNGSLNALLVKIYVGTAYENFPFYIFILIYAFGLTSHWNLYSVHTVVSTGNTNVMNTVLTTYFLIY
jgi:hypothetical protein